MKDEIPAPAMLDALSSRRQERSGRAEGIELFQTAFEYLPATRFFAPTVQTRSGSREKFFDPANPVHRAAQKDTLLQSEKAKVKRQKGVEYLPTARFFAPAVQTQASSREKFFGATGPVRKAAQNDKLLGIFDPANRAHRAAQNDTLFGFEHLPSARFFGPANPAHKAAQNDTLFGPPCGMVQKIYTAEIGIRESTGKNDGKRIEDYLTYVGLGKGNPWCAAFICWVYGKAGVTNPRSGWSPVLFPESRIVWSRRRSLIKHSSLNIKHSAGPIKHSKFNIQNSPGPRRADIFGIWFQDKKRIAHCGFIDDWQEKYVITVEGNTNESGSREGDGVYRKRRLISTVYKVARWVG